VTDASPGERSGLYSDGWSGPLRRWILLDGNRWAVAGALAVGLFAFLVVVGSLDPTPIREMLDEKDMVETVFASLSTAIVTGVTIVVTIDQVVLSQQLGPLGDQRSRLTESIDFRREAESLLGDTAPAEPAALLRALLGASDEAAEELRDAIVDGDNPEGAREEVERFLADHRADAAAVRERLADERYLHFDALRAVLEYRYEWRVHEALRIRRRFDGRLDDRSEEALAELVRALRLFGPAREHARGLHFQSQLVYLSRVILAAAVPALAVALAVVIFLDAGDIPGTTLGVSNLLLAVSGAATVAVCPFFVLVSYVFRIVTITGRTLATGPFLLHETDHPDRE
jgi:hypothetical protein